MADFFKATPTNKMESKNTLIQSTAGAVPVRNEKGKENIIKNTNSTGG